MIGMIDWVVLWVRMVLVFIVFLILVGVFVYVGLLKEGELDIEILVLFVLVFFFGIFVVDSECLLVKLMEIQLVDFDGLKIMLGIVVVGYVGVVLEFEFGWDKIVIMLDVCDVMNVVEVQFFDGVDSYLINEINFSEFLIVIVNLIGDVLECILICVGKEF